MSLFSCHIYLNYTVIPFYVHEDLFFYISVIVSLIATLRMVLKPILRLLQFYSVNILAFRQFVPIQFVN